MAVYSSLHAILLLDSSCIQMEEKKKGTKLISARVPFEFYLDVLNDSQSREMTISDYIIWKISNCKKYEESITDLKVKLREKESEARSIRITAENAVKESTGSCKRLADEVRRLKKLNDLLTKSQNLEL